MLRMLEVDEPPLGLNNQNIQDRFVVYVGDGSTPFDHLETDLTRPLVEVRGDLVAVVDTIDYLVQNDYKVVISPDEIVDEPALAPFWAGSIALSRVLKKTQEIFVGDMERDYIFLKTNSQSMLALHDFKIDVRFAI